ncbi:MAG: ankyrin repeat domain-containing protein, partial [bacterium]|nr:ankyrin repeat domain-containing protein [bacterium]
MLTAAAVFVLACALCAQTDAPPKNIFEAARQGDVDAVKAFVAKNQSILSLDEIGSTPLHHAAAGGHALVVNYLLDNGADPNLVNN